MFKKEVYFTISGVIILSKEYEEAYFFFIHPIHRFKSSDWLKEGHMTWIIFNNVHVWKLIHVC